MLGRHSDNVRQENSAGVLWLCERWGGERRLEARRWVRTDCPNKLQRSPKLGIGKLSGASIEGGWESFNWRTNRTRATWVWTSEVLNFCQIPRKVSYWRSGRTCIFLTVIWNPIICLPQVQTLLLRTQNNYTTYGFSFDFSIRGCADAIATFARKVTASVVLTLENKDENRMPEISWSRWGKC